MSRISTINKTRGFTIVELLVVIVVIGILAAITLVSYNGITARANTSSGQSTANNVIQKVGAYNVDANDAKGFPDRLSLLTGAASTTTYNMSGVSTQAAVAQANTTSMTAPSANPYAGVIQYAICGYKTVTGTPTVLTIGTPATALTELQTAPGSTGGVITGVKVSYWKFDDGTAPFLTAGVTSGNVAGVAVNCVTTGS